MRIKSAVLTIAALVAPLLTGADSEGAPPRRQALPNFLLRTQDNQPVRFYDELVKGRTVVISFMFTSCTGICPRTSANLLKVQKKLGDHVGRDVFFYSITLDPDTDTPAVLKSYARKIGAPAAGWTFLTGKREELELLRHALGAYDADPKVDADRTQHGAMIIYGNDAIGRWSMMPALVAADRIAEAVGRMLPPGPAKPGR